MGLHLMYLPVQKVFKYIYVRYCLIKLQFIPEFCLKLILFISMYIYMYLQNYEPYDISSKMSNITYVTAPRNITYMTPPTEILYDQFGD